MAEFVFETPADFKIPTDVKKEGDVHRFLLDAECIGMKDGEGAKWEMKALDGVNLPDSDGDEGMDEYDESSDEPDEGDQNPKSAKDLSLLLIGKGQPEPDEND